MHLLLVGLACLFPVALYCLYMALLHNRRAPTMISGPWDFVGVLIAISGFLLIGGTVLVFSLHSVARDYWLRGGGFADFARTHSQADTITFTLWGLYAFVLVGGSALLIWGRKEYTAVYNLAPAELEHLLQRACERLGLSFARRGARFILGHEAISPDSRPPEWSRRLTVDLDGSPSMRYVSLRWVFATPEARRELEAELARDLPAYESSASPVAGWFVTAAGALMVLMIFGLGTFLILARR